MDIEGKKILHVITVSSEGGAQSVVVNLANAQCADNAVHIISSADGGSWKALDKRVNTIPIRQLRKKIGPWDIIVLLKLLYYRFKLRPDIVHLHSSKIGVLGRIVFPTRKTIYTVHGFDSIRVANRRFLFLEKTLQKMCRYIVGVSRYDERNLLSEGIRNHVACIYNGVIDVSADGISDANIPTAAFIEELRHRFSGVVISIAREEKPKRMDLFLDIARTMPDYAFVWIGNESDHEKPDNTFLLGMIPQAYQLLRYCDVFVLCSDFEGLPMSIIEAMSLGRPVVASNVGGISEILDGNNGTVVSNDTAAFREAIERYLKDESLYRQTSMEARRTYLSKFTVDRMVEDYARLYRNSLSHSI